MSNSSEYTPSAYQPGGTVALICNKWVSHVCNSCSDALGRWSYVAIKGKKGRKVTTISAYHVCKNSLDQAGPTTCWKQQWRQLKTKESRIEQDEELIIKMDANDTDQANSDFRKFH
eukprot:5467485-Ditylum_brightwellii.AAC.1